MGSLESELRETGAVVVAVCISAGGIPKRRVEESQVQADGLAGDAHNHEKHRRLHRAVCIVDVEVLEQLQAEGYAVEPGTIGENLTVRGLNVQKLLPGDMLYLQGGPVLELTEARKPCYVLDVIHPAIQQAVVGRCGYLARVISPGRVFVGQRIALHTPNWPRRNSETNGPIR